MYNNSIAVCIILDASTFAHKKTFISVDGLDTHQATPYEIMLMIAKESTLHTSPQYACELLLNTCRNDIPGAVKTLQAFMTEKYRYIFDEEE